MTAITLVIVVDAIFAVLFGLGKVPAILLGGGVGSVMASWIVDRIALF